MPEFTKEIDMNIREYSENVSIITENCSFYQLKKWKEDGILIFGSEPSTNKGWPLGRRVKLIESVLMSIPLAPIFANADSQGRLIIFDGLNRLSSVFGFMDNGFPLEALQILCSYNNKIYSSLPPSLQNKISNSTIQLCVIKSGTAKKIAASILQRVNIKATPIKELIIIDSLKEINKE